LEEVMGSRKPEIFEQPDFLRKDSEIDLNFRSKFFLIFPQAL
jgi:hypothetical protein